MTRWSVLVVLVLGACTTETKERGLMGQWGRTGSSADPGAESAPAKDQPAEQPRGTVVDIPAEVADQFREFVNRPSTLYADAVEIDLSRNGWFALSSFAFARDAVDRRDEEDAAKGLLTITLTRKPEVPATKDSVPTVRFGDGLRVVGVDRIVMRFSARQSADRPIWFQAVGAGKRALYAIEKEPPKKWAGTSVVVQSEIRRTGGPYRFDWSAEGKP
jgi:hypothetical protein